MSGFNSGKAIHNVFNRSVYFRFNQCNFIPNCAYEREYKKVIYKDKDNNPCITLDIYITDNSQYIRATVSKARMSQVCGFAGVLISNMNHNKGEIIHIEVNPSDRMQGYCKQLLALLHANTGIKPYAIHKTADGEKALK